MPRKGLPDLMLCVHHVDQAVLSRFRMQSGNAPTPGSTTLRCAQDRFRVARDHGLVAHALKALLNAP